MAKSAKAVDIQDLARSLQDFALWEAELAKSGATNEQREFDTAEHTKRIHEGQKYALAWAYANHPEDVGNTAAYLALRVAGLLRLNPDATASLVVAAVVVGRLHDSIEETQWPDHMKPRPAGTVYDKVDVTELLVLYGPLVAAAVSWLSRSPDMDDDTYLGGIKHQPKLFRPASERDKADNGVLAAFKFESAAQERFLFAAVRLLVPLVKLADWLDNANPLKRAYSNDMAEQMLKSQEAVVAKNDPSLHIEHSALEAASQLAYDKRRMPSKDKYLEFGYALMEAFGILGLSKVQSHIAGVISAYKLNSKEFLNQPPLSDMKPRPSLNVAPGLYSL